MRKEISILIGILFLMFSCKEVDKNIEKEVTTTSQTIKDTKISANNILCNINGKPWSYTEASGVLVEDKNIGVRVLKLTFTKYLNPGKEHISLTYNEATKALLEASVQIKQQGKEDKRIHAIYLFNDRIKEESPNGTISGQMDINDGKASGTAQLQNIPIRYEGALLANPKDAEITVTELSFDNIPFSDVKKEMEAIFKNSK